MYVGVITGRAEPRVSGSVAWERSPGAGISHTFLRKLVLWSRGPHLRPSALDQCSRLVCTWLNTDTWVPTPRSSVSLVLGVVWASVFYNTPK